MYGFGFFMALFGRSASHGAFAVSLDFSDARNSDYIILIF